MIGLAWTLLIGGVVALVSTVALMTYALSKGDRHLLLIHIGMIVVQVVIIVMNAAVIAMEQT